MLDINSYLLYFMTPMSEYMRSKDKGGCIVDLYYCQK